MAMPALGAVLTLAALTSIPSARAVTKVEPRDGLTYVSIPPGASEIGCSAGDAECFAWEPPRHKVTIAKGVWIGQTEVTQQAYSRVTGTNPSRYRGPSLPVDQVSWNNAQRYCAAIGMRLPTEAEWEYAARGGSANSRYGPLESIAWYDGNSQDKTRPAGQKNPNAFGLYDMLGNVWEWVQDSHEANRDMRILRGGSFFNVARDLRVSNRLWALPDTAHRNMGFRCAR
jgi:formylglycine-generating enzyme required for sulfatase activity